MNYFEYLLGWAIEISPYLALIIIGIILGFISALAYKYLTKQDKIRDIKKEMSLVGKEMKINKNNPDELMKLQHKQMNLNLSRMKYMFIVLFINVVAHLLVIYYMAPLMYGITAWFWVYLVSNILSVVIFRKLFKVA